MMATTVRMNMVLTGPRAGQNIELSGHYFYKGVCPIIGQDDKLGPCIKVLSTYGAYPEGSGAYKRACTKYKAIMKEQNGLSNIQKSTKSGKTKKVLSDIQSGGKGPSKKETIDDPSDNEANEGTEGIHSSGDRHEDSGIRTEQKPENRESDTKKSAKTESGISVEDSPETNKRLLKAIMSLDAENDDHWVKTGKNAGMPKISVIEEAYGETGITRADVEAAASGHNKDVALEIIVSNL